MRQARDYWSVRQLKWLMIAMAVLIAVGGVAVWLREHEPSRVAFHRYLDAIAAGRVADAYKQLCPESREAMPDYAERLNRSVAEIGKIEGRGDIHASRKGLGAAFIDGARKDVRVFVRMRNVDGTWRPCPSEGPLGRIETA